MKDPRLTALRRFSISLTAFNILGYYWFGFEQPWLWPFMAVGTACATELLLETLSAWAGHRAPAYQGSGAMGMVNFLMPAYITGLAVNMLLYANDKPWPVVFAIVVAVGQKTVLRARIGGKVRHFMNPSNFGITVTLLLWNWISIAPPYEFSENLDTPARWIVPAAILASGTLLNAKLTRKMPLIAGWVLAFAGQAVLRHFLFGTSMISALLVMTGIAFVLFMNYMMTDPATTPVRPRNQVAFGAGVAIVYGALVDLHIVFGLFFALCIVCGIRGVYHWSAATVRALRPAAPVPEPVPAEVPA
jgi:hypothetical protein